MYNDNEGTEGFTTSELSKNKIRLELVELNSTKMGAVSFVNLCPHDVTLMDGNGMKLTFKASGQVARLDSKAERSHLTIGIAEGMEIGLPLQEIEDGAVYGLPEPQENTIYITSYIIAKHVRRPDVISPLTDQTAIRDEDNRVVGVRGFQRFK